MVELDILRGFLLVWMTLTHLPTSASVIANQTFGFVSGAEGFIFLSAFMIGLIEERAERKAGLQATFTDLAKRAGRVYFYHAALLTIAFALFARLGVAWHRLSLENLLSFYVQNPQRAVLAAALLDYRPSLLDILPMYVVFMAITPLARGVAARWGWRMVLAIGAAFWLAAQFGLRAWVYRHFDPLQLGTPENSTGSFDMYAWQLLWIVGVALGSSFSGSISGNEGKPALRIPTWLLTASVAVATLLLVLRYSPVDQWMNPDLYGHLIDKWHLGIVRIVDFTAIAVILIKWGERVAAFPLFSPLARLSRASIEVFSVHVLCCLTALTLSPAADPALPWWQQALVVVLSMTALFATAVRFK
jgi:hypothetical protein